MTPPPSSLARRATPRGGPRSLCLCRKGSFDLKLAHNGNLPHVSCGPRKHLLDRSGFVKLVRVNSLLSSCLLCRTVFCLFVWSSDCPLSPTILFCFTCCLIECFVRFCFATRTHVVPHVSCYPREHLLARSSFVKLVRVATFSNFYLCLICFKILCLCVCSNFSVCISVPLYVPSVWLFEVMLTATYLSFAFC